MIERTLQSPLVNSLKTKSILLLGPRQTGKSTLIKSLNPDVSFNLAHEKTFLEFMREPSYLENVLAELPKKKKTLIFIDEIQKIPRLMNTLQVLIDENKEDYRFILTGSSARKLKRNKTNMLPGRLHTYELGSLTSKELEYSLDTNKVLSLGSLPEIYLEQDLKSAKKLLKSYATTYLHEEIKAEALTKNLESFTRFLFKMAAESSKFLDLSKISRVSAVPRQTTQRFFEIMEDTLIIKRCDAFAKSDKRRLTQHPRFFFFDTGVVNAMLNNFMPSADRMGFLFETLVFNQLSTSLAYTDEDYRISSYRTEAGTEIDFILELGERLIAIEVKVGGYSDKDLRGFESFQSFVGKKEIEKIVLVPDKQRSQKTGDIRFLSWQDFLKENDW
ncbi:MAG: AAA family ATPase [Oligoflexia bacterium]|nr:AAA family ATPase [Oligoflexia bacterium]